MDVITDGMKQIFITDGMWNYSVNERIFRRFLHGSIVRRKGRKEGRKQGRLEREPRKR
jgi:hypothetical protein